MFLNTFFERKNIFKIKKVDYSIIEELSSLDSYVSYTDYGDNRKPLFGALFEQEEFTYIVPLSSPKRKHLNMRESLDFKKIVNDNNDLLGVVNLNNMIPYPTKNLQDLPISEIHEIRTNDSAEELLKYQALVDIELDILNKRVTKIRNDAMKVYKIKTLWKNNQPLENRCVDFKKLEEYLSERGD